MNKKIESVAISPNGRMVDVGQNKMHVYLQGNNITYPTLVFMSGSGTVAPVYDFKCLYNLLTPHFRIAVVEKFGYGYSDICDISRDIDSMVAELRSTLKCVQVNPPFVLFPHSMSGLEAIYWKQKYPDEVAAIVGLDMATPLSYENFTITKVQKMLPVLNVLLKLGLHKIPRVYPLNTLSLTDEEKHQQKLLMYRNALNVSYIREGESVLKNAEKVKRSGSIKCPTLLFSSNGKQIGKYWVSNQEQFAKEVGARLIKYDCGHYLHYYKSNEMALLISEFVREIPVL